MTVQLTLAEATSTDRTVTTTTPDDTGPEAVIQDDGQPEQCTCVWPAHVEQVDVLLGRNEARQEKRRVIDQCQECGGEVR